MNQFLVRKAIGQSFPYVAINKYLNEDDIEKGRVKLNNNFRKITSVWNSTLNSEWVLRNYLATKMILSSTVMLTSLEYGKEKTSESQNHTYCITLY